MRLAVVAVLLAGCTTSTLTVPAQSAAPGMKRWEPANATRPHSTVKHLPRRRGPNFAASRSLVRGPTVFNRLAQCESGGNPRAVDPTGQYFGLYQFTRQTWASVGGRGLPSDASPAEQTYRAELLFARDGWAPWPTCGAS